MLTRINRVGTNEVEAAIGAADSCTIGVTLAVCGRVAGGSALSPTLFWSTVAVAAASTSAARAAAPSPTHIANPTTTPVAGILIAASCVPSAHIEMQPCAQSLSLTKQMSYRGNQSG